MNISYLKYFEINPIKWDKCINSSFNGIVYAYSWYLNIVSEEWDALVLDDYTAVMPIIHNKKLLVNYLYQPMFTQQLGIFSTKKLNSTLVEDFLKKIPKKYWLIEINLNIFNKLKPLKGFKYDFRPTHELDLINNYQLSYKSYSENTRRNIKKAIKQKVSIITAVTINEFISFVKKNLSDKAKGFSENDFDTLKLLTSGLLRYKAGDLYGAFSKNNDLCAVALFANAHNKSIYLVGASNSEGYQNKAMFLLIDHFIKINSEHNIILDFEGSRIEGIARFYKGFGAKESKYPNVKRNKLPFFLNFLRKFRLKIKNK